MRTNTFHAARIKLTAWYLLIIMLISVFFTSVIYTGINNELIRIDRQQQLRKARLERSLPLTFPQGQMPKYELQDISQSRGNLIIILVFINIVILIISGAAGYFLAGKTLKPIKGMIDDQNRFIGDASHELRTPLTALRSEIEVNLRDRFLTLPEAKKLLQSNLEETIHLQTLSDNLIKLTSTNKLTMLTLLPISIKTVVEEAIKKVTPLAKNKQVKIESSLIDITIDGDNATLVELFVTLLDNAIKYSPENAVVKVTTSKTTNSVNVLISDSGIGISKKDLPHIFDRFYRADESRTKSEIGGFGLGLSIAKHIAEAHNGNIHVTSVVQKGSTFKVHLPIKR
jgi:two-component system sensor histidine kinase CiaH